ncbi:hypothetical protein LPJ81_007195, partial [Coemansia sp. IMI 209127]
MYSVLGSKEMYTQKARFSSSALAVVDGLLEGLYGIDEAPDAGNSAKGSNDEAQGQLIDADIPPANKLDKADDRHHEENDR